MGYESNTCFSSSDCPMIPATPGTCSNPLTSRDIGNVGSPGSTTFSQNGWSLKGVGRFGNQLTQDSLHYAYMPFTGDVDVIIRLESYSAAWDRPAGVMLRETLDQSSRYYAMIRRGDGLLRAYRREGFAASSAGSNTANSVTVRSPVWLRIRVVNGQFTSFHSVVDNPSSESDWTTLERASNLRFNSDSRYVGLAIGADTIGRELRVSKFMVNGKEVGGECTSNTDCPFDTTCENFVASTRAECTGILPYGPCVFGEPTPMPRWLRRYSSQKHSTLLDLEKEWTDAYAKIEDPANDPPWLEWYLDIRDIDPFEGEHCIEEGITGDDTLQLKQCQRDWLLDKTNINPYENFLVEYENVVHPLRNGAPFNETCVDDVLGEVRMCD